MKYGFHTYGLESRTGALRWSHRSASPLIAVLGSPRLATSSSSREIETFAIEADGTVGWRIAHSDVVSDAALVGGRLVLTSFTGQVSAVDPRPDAASRPDGRPRNTEVGRRPARPDGARSRRRPHHPGPRRRTRKGPKEPTRGVGVDAIAAVSLRSTPPG